MAIAIQRIQQQQHEAISTKRSFEQAAVYVPNMTPTTISPMADTRTNVDLPRAASYTYLPTIKDNHYPNPALVTIRGLNQDNYVQHVAEPIDISPPDSSGWTTPDEHPSERILAQPELVEQLQKGEDQELEYGHAPIDIPIGTARSSVELSVRQSLVSLESARSFSTLATTPSSGQHYPSSLSFSRRFDRQSWYGSHGPSPARSPSPPVFDEPLAAEEEVILDYVGVAPKEPARPATSSEKKERRKSFIRRMSMTFTKQDDVSQDAAEETPRPLTRSTSDMAVKTKRRLSGVFGKNDHAIIIQPGSGVPDVPALPVLPKSFSTDRLPSLRRDSTFADRAAPVPKLVLSDRTLQSGTNVLTRKKDELWSVFRALDGDYAKFASKSTSLKANVVRTALIPFLKAYAAHPSNRTVRAEDLDRRATILNKWWTGMIEMLHGRNNQSISGTDRPVILDGISGIMDRPEWRLAPSPFCPLDQRMKGTSTPRSRSNVSLPSASSDFLSESVHHNVRNIFIQNLSAQMAFVVDKMSMKNASASLVTFCGKACAYAFMFVPGMADVLVRLWDLQMDILRRVLEENDIAKFDHLPASTSSLVSDFPPALHQLGFTSLSKYMKKLRTPPSLPLGTAHVQWWGHWLERWTGRESDLFYVFVKHFHILITDFLPMHSTKQERMGAPGMLLVHAQILTNLDSTIHREASPHQLDPTVAPSPSFDDVLGGADAVASALPVPPVNATRLMAENRLIMLIRDFLSDRIVDYPVARDIFAESFHDLLQAAAKGTSIFNHAACYTLLDFLEEALVILTRYESVTQDGTMMNLDFWLLVCRRMIMSENTLTEIRLYGFLYTIWNSLAPDHSRKLDLCVGLLLDPEIFESRFNHWSPMVRAFYMRLLCWRVARFDGTPSFADLQILETLWERLQQSWGYYTFLHDQAEQGLDYYPLSAPSNPAPGRRLLILRTDGSNNHHGSFLSFDGKVAQSPMHNQDNAWKLMSTVSTVIEGAVKPPTRTKAAAEKKEKGIGAFFRRMLGTSSSIDKTGVSDVRSATNLSIRSMPELRPPTLNRAATDSAPDLTRRRTSLIDITTNTLTGFGFNTPQSLETQPQPILPPKPRHFCFKFSLEFLPPNAPPSLPALRLLPPRLPPAAQSFLHFHSPVFANRIRTDPIIEPIGVTSAARARYAGRALAEWTLVVGECAAFFERRMAEGGLLGVEVETPGLGIEVFKK